MAQKCILTGSSPPSKVMEEKELYITATIIKNRLAGANHKLPSNKAMKNAGRGTSSEVSAEDGKLCVVKWYANKPVLMMSVVHGTQPEDTCQRWDKKLKQCHRLTTKHCLQVQHQVGWH